jgi:hypothetical protein
LDSSEPELRQIFRLIRLQQNPIAIKPRKTARKRGNQTPIRLRPALLFSTFYVAAFWSVQARRDGFDCVNCCGRSKSYLSGSATIFQWAIFGLVVHNSLCFGGIGVTFKLNHAGSAIPIAVIDWLTKAYISPLPVAISHHDWVGGYLSRKQIAGVL